MTLRFGTDGVRGIANRELTPELVTALGRAAVRVLGADEPFVIGRDTRRSGPMLEAALVAGLCAEGADVVLTGVLPTPGVAHVARERGAPAAVISATHPGDLQEAVLVARADAGLAFDGDADRVIAVDERGVLVDGDEILAITAIDMHDRKLLRGNAVVATVMSNLGLRRALEPYGVG